MLGFFANYSPRKKEEIIAMVSAIKNVLTVLAVARSLLLIDASSARGRKFCYFFGI
jgi:hypothetical protein